MKNTGTAIGSHAPDFELPGIDDRVYHLARYLDQYRVVAVIFMCNHCPYVGAYLERLKQLQADFQEKGFTAMGINSNDMRDYPEDSFESMKRFASFKELNFPYLRDANQDVARGFGAQKTPEVFLLDREGVIRYNGAIDDNAEEPTAVKEPYLRSAIGSLLAGESIAIASTQVVGCDLKWRPSES